MIENLLDVSRISSQRVQPDLDAFDLCKLIHDVVGRFRASRPASWGVDTDGPSRPGR